MRYIVRAIPQRIKGVEYLQSKIPDLEIVMDTTRNAFDTFLHAMKIAGDDSAVHLEDDAILTKDFLIKAEGIIRGYPDNIVQFFSRRQKDIKRGSRWEAGGNFSCNVGFYLPGRFPKLFLEFFEEWKINNQKYCTSGYVYMMNDFLRMTGESYWIQIPNLVDHRVSVSSVGKGKARSRVSKTFEDPDL